MKQNKYFSRDEQYNFGRMTYVYEQGYSINVSKVLPSEMWNMKFVVGKSGVDVYKDVILETTLDYPFCHPANKNLCYIKKGIKFKKKFLKKRINNNSYGIVDMLQPNCYYHWLINDFPRILLCYQAGYKNIIINSDKLDIKKLCNFQLDCLKILPGIRLYSLNLFEGQKMKKICIPILPDEYGGEEKIVNGIHIYDYYTHRVTRYVIKKMPKIFKLKENNKRRRIKIQRRDIENDRESSNIGEFNQFLIDEWNFDIIYLEDYSVQKQMQMMYDSEIVIGAHGSGLANFIAANKKSVLMEYGSIDYYEKQSNYNNFSRVKTKNFFHFMCELKGNEYIYIPVNNKRIDIKGVDAKLKSVINKK